MMLICRNSLCSICLIAGATLATATVDDSAVDVGNIETLIQFQAPDTAASITIVSKDIAYIATGFSGKICRVDLRNSSDECEPFFAFPLNNFPIEQGGCVVPGKLPNPTPIVLSVFIHSEDDTFIYASVNACSASNHGVWRINTETRELDTVYNAPHGPGNEGIVLNGITVHNGVIYGADYFYYKVWSVPMDGTDPQVSKASSNPPMFSLWSEDPLFTPLLASPWQGPNGLKTFENELYVAVSGGGNIVKCNIGTKDCRVHVTFPQMPCCSDDSGCSTFNGEIETVFGDPEGSINVCATPMGCDEFDLDKNFEENDIIICSTDPYGVIVLLDPAEGDESMTMTQILVDGFNYPNDANLDGPSSVAFGRTEETRNKLYITNAAFPILPPPIAGTKRNPSLMVLDLTISTETSTSPTNAPTAPITPKDTRTSSKYAPIALWTITITLVWCCLAFSM